MIVLISSDDMYSISNLSRPVPEVMQNHAAFFKVMLAANQMGLGGKRLRSVDFRIDPSAEFHVVELHGVVDTDQADAMSLRYRCGERGEPRMSDGSEPGNFGDEP